MLAICRCAVGFSLLLMAACATEDSQLAFSKEAAIEPGVDYAVIDFYHPFGLSDLPVAARISATPGATGAMVLLTPSWLYQIWTPHGLAALLPGGCAQVRVPAGHHVFLARFVRWNAGNWTVLEADVAAGKTYFVQVSQRWNTWKPAVKLQVVRPSGLVDSGRPCSAGVLTFDRSAPANREFWERHEAQNRRDVRAVYDSLRAGQRGYYFDRPIVSEDGS